MNKEFTDWLVGQLKARDWNQNELADRAGIAQSTVSMILKGRSRPGLEFCVGVAKALGVSDVEVLRRAGLITAFEPEVDAETLRSIGEQLKDLTEDEVRDLMEIMYLIYRQIRRRRERAHGAGGRTP